MAFDRVTGFRTRSMLCAPVRNHVGTIIGVTQAMNNVGGSFWTGRRRPAQGPLPHKLPSPSEISPSIKGTVTLNNYLVSIGESISNGIPHLDQDYHEFGPTAPS